jgi:hypothetical protein
MIFHVKHAQQGRDAHRADGSGRSRRWPKLASVCDRIAPLGDTLAQAGDVTRLETDEQVLQRRNGDKRNEQEATKHAAKRRP